VDVFIDILVIHNVYSSSTVIKLPKNAYFHSEFRCRILCFSVGKPVMLGTCSVYLCNFLRYITVRVGSEVMSVLLYRSCCVLIRRHFTESRVIKLGSH